MLKDHLKQTRNGPFLIREYFVPNQFGLPMHTGEFPLWLDKYGYPARGHIHAESLDLITVLPDKHWKKKRKVSPVVAIAEAEKLGGEYYTKWAKQLRELFDIE